MKTSIRHQARAAICLALTTAALVLCSATARCEIAVEQPGQLQADHYLSAEQLSGPDWAVESDVTNDGFTNVYRVNSRFGTWEARGKADVSRRIREIQALAQLETVSKSDVFLDAVKNSVTAPIDLVASAATKPVETLKGIPGGVGRWFKKTSFRVSETYHDVKEASQGGDEEGEAEGEPTNGDKAKSTARGAAAKHFKVSAAERNWYAKLGVDPYTDNELLRQAISSVAKVEGLTNFGMKFVGLPAVPGMRELSKTMDLVWKTDPWELRQRNRKMMLGAGLSEATARAFEDNPALSLTMQTLLLDTLGDMEHVGGRASVIARAIDVKSREEATLLTASVALLENFNTTQGPLQEILEGTRLPVARTATGDLVAVMPADAVFWTEAIRSAAHGFAAVYAKQPAGKREFWVVGEASPRFKEGAKSLGWEVHDEWKPVERRKS